VDLNCDGEISDGDGDLIWHEPPAGDATKDIYLQLDSMEGSGFIEDPVLGVIPEPFDHSPPVHPTTGVSAVEVVRNAFAREGIVLHVDTSGPALPHGQLIYFPAPTLECATALDPVTGEPSVNFYDYKPSSFDPRRRIGYHYLISAHSSCVSTGGVADTDGAGFAEIPGNDAVVSMGAYRYYQSTSCEIDLDCCPTCSPNPYTCQSHVCVSRADQVRRHQEWAGTLMHELGHNLGLCHNGPGDPTADAACGSENERHTPNHISSMNYLFQLG
jgi:hypothetical protein